MSTGLFRQVSLDRLSSPEQLDQLIKVTSPKGWLALIAISCILISAVAWGFLGSITTKIHGYGILLNDGGVFYVKHHTSGQVIDIRFKMGDIVRKGDVLARIEVPELVSEINRLLNTLQKTGEIQGTDSMEYEVIKNQIKQLRGELDKKSQIVSQIDGRILELNLANGSIIIPGQPLAALERYGETVKLEAVIYVPADQGGIINPGMEAQISPSVVKKEEYGFMLGRVISVSEFPATSKNMLQTLGSESLVDMLLQSQGASLMIRIDLIPDSNTVSGYKWSTPQGPPSSVHSGTIIHCEVITRRERPINKVIPLLGKK